MFLVKIIFKTFFIKQLPLFLWPGTKSVRWKLMLVMVMEKKLLSKSVTEIISKIRSRTRITVLLVLHKYTFLFMIKILPVSS